MERATTQAIVGALTFCGICGTAVVDAQRICSNPRCVMCNRLEAAYRSRTQFYQVVPTVAAQPAPKATAMAQAKRFGPTDRDAIPAILGALSLDSGETLVDIGAGDARILIAACQAYPGLRAIGYEIKPDVARLAETKVAEAGLADRITIIEGDATQIADLEGRTVYSYMWESVTDRMRNELATADRVVSLHHKLPLPTEPRTIKLGDREWTLHVYTRPQGQVRAPAIDWTLLDRAARTHE